MLLLSGRKVANSSEQSNQRLSSVLIETPVTPKIPLSTQTQGEHDDLVDPT